jgi:hypothetical protein
MTKVAVVNISMKRPWVRDVPAPRDTPTFRGPGVSASRIAAATMAPTICAVAVTAMSETDMKYGSTGRTDESDWPDSSNEDKSESYAGVHDRPGESVEDGSDGEEGKPKGGRNVVVRLGR